jgi:hypothetical protein
MGFGPYHPRLSLWYMLIIIICMSLYYNYQEILFLRPQSIHQWRQCYGLSFTMNYYQDNNPLLQPALHFLGGDGTGKTAGEFPLLYYLTARLWKVFGYHEFIFRLVNLSIFLIGLIALMKIFEDILKDSILAITFSLLSFASPVLVYYANNFIPNIPSLGFVMIAWYLFWLFYKTEKNIFLWSSFLVFTLAGLIKVTAIISIVALLAIFCLEATGILKFRKGSRLFKHPFIQWIPFILAFGLIFSWYLYANYYNRHYNADLLAVGILPIWDLTGDEIHNHFLGIREQVKWSYFHQSMYWILITFFTFIIIFFKKADKLMLLLTFLIFTGIISYFLLFFKMLFQHDYYIIDLYIYLPITCLTLMYILKNQYPVLFRSIFLKSGLVILLIINAGFTKHRITERYSMQMNDNYLLNIKRFENITPYLRSIGIGPDDKVLCLPDESPVISLYFMNQKGWTNYSTNLDSTRIKSKINMGADYLFIYIDSLFNNPNIKPFIKNKIGEINDIDIYDISSFRINRK